MSIGIPIALGSDSRSAEQFNAQRVTNMLVERAPSNTARAEYMLFRLPGLKPHCSLNLGSAIRGMQELSDNEFLAVCATNLYLVNVNGSTTLKSSSILGTAPVSMAKNGTQVFIAGDVDAYIYDIAAGTLLAITDTGYSNNFKPTSSVTYIDTYFYTIKKNSRIKALSNNNDGSVFDPLDTEQSQFIIDEILRAIAFGEDVWVFGKTRIEVDRNTGNGDFPFDVPTGTRREYGCGAKLSVATGRDKIAWLSNKGIVYAAEGFSAIPISNRQIETELEKMSTYADAEGYIFDYMGHELYVLTLPTGGKTFIYDFTEQLWTDAESYNLGYWRARYGIRCGKRVFVGDANSNEIFELRHDYFKDGNEPIVREIVSSTVFSNNQRLAHHEIELIGNTGIGLETGSDANPFYLLSWSDNGGKTYTSELDQSPGTIGNYDVRVRWINLGQSSPIGRIYKIRMSAAVDWAVCALYIEASLRK